MTDGEQHAVALEVMRVEIKHLRELMDRSDKALNLQAIEYERRLTALNHEAERLKAMQSTYFPRELAEPMNERIASIERNMWKAIGGLVVLWAVARYFMK